MKRRIILSAVRLVRCPQCVTVASVTDHLNYVKRRRIYSIYFILPNTLRQTFWVVFLVKFVPRMRAETSIAELPVKIRRH